MSRIFQHAFMRSYREYLLLISTYSVSNDAIQRRVRDTEVYLSVYVSIYVSICLSFFLSLFRVIHEFVSVEEILKV
jgi:hypothetical protein